jgi:magnesium transporter
VEEIRTKEIKETIENLLQLGDYKTLSDNLEDFPDVEIAEMLNELETEPMFKTLSQFPPERRGAIASHFDIDLLHGMFQMMERKMYATVFENIQSDVRADVYQELSLDEQTQLLPFLDKKTREDVLHLSSYPPETAGGIMTTDFAFVLKNMNVTEAIEKVRKDAPSRKMVYYVYVVDEDMKLLGFITLKDLILANPKTPVEDIIHEDYIHVSVYEDREEVARKVEKYDLVAIPVLNPLNQLVGIVRHDDALDVIRAEHSEDMEKFMGIISTDDFNYEDTTVWTHFKKRIVWIVSLAAVGIVSGMIIHKYEGMLESFIILALYLPMIADTGGNCGSQSATVVIRALALGQVTIKDWWKIIYKEARVSFLVSICLGVLAFLKVLFLSWETSTPAGFSLMFVALIISIALSLQVIASTIIGAGLPMMVKRFGGDPAVAASPAITTVVDIVGLLIYFGLATTFFVL